MLHEPCNAEAAEDPAAAAVIGIFWWYKGADMVQAVEQGTEAGASYGQQHDDRACQQRGLELMADCDDMVCGMYDQAFLSACLSQASEGGLCEDVPKDLGFSGTLVWVSKRCEELAQEESECTGMMQTVLQHCAR